MTGKALNDIRPEPSAPVIMKYIPHVSLSSYLCIISSYEEQVEAHLFFPSPKPSKIIKPPVPVCLDFQHFSE